MKHYFILGGGILQLDFIRVVQRNGYAAHVIDYDPECPGAAIADYFHLCSIDDIKGVLELAKSYRPAGIHTVATEMGNVTACCVAEELGLMCNSCLTAKMTTDKTLMKKHLIKSGIQTARYDEFHEYAELERDEPRFPVVVKAADRSAGRGVSLAKSYPQLEKAFDEAYQESLNKTVLVEEYIEGPQYSIETLSVKGQHHIIGITQEGISGPPYFVETEHQFPAEITPELYAQMEALARKVLDSFVVHTGAGHIEVRVTEDDIYVIELASRMGGLRHWLVQKSYDIDYLQAIFDSTFGKKPNLQKREPVKKSISRFVTTTEDYQKYLELKKSGEYEFIADFVHAGVPQSEAKDLMTTHGFYLFTDQKA